MTYSGKYSSQISKLEVGQSKTLVQGPPLSNFLLELISNCIKSMVIGYHSTFLIDQNRKQNFRVIEWQRLRKSVNSGRMSLSEARDIFFVRRHLVAKRE